MEIWLIINGTKSGPHHDYDIRGRIQRGELNRDVHAWHDGLSAWKPLEKIELFASEFTNSENSPPPLPMQPRETPDLTEQPASSPTLKPRSVWIRFWARWFDMILYATVMWGILSLSGRDLADLMMNLWFTLFMYVPWFLIESYLIYQFGTTPGKWLLGLRVENMDGSPIPFANSAYRAARVFFTGIGMGWQLLSIFCQALSWFTVRKIGKSMWDVVGGHEVRQVPIKPIRIAIFAMLLSSIVMLQGAILAPYTARVLAENAPEFKKFLEKHDIPIAPQK
ncbi:MAG: RDD family protein [Verrucomicrobia bacterium]|nr:MAG: RDD family protein [Verrucomicrobiota bacterium]